MKTFVSHTCPHCKKEFEVYIAYLNKANSIGAPRYCGKACSGLARRDNKTKEQKIVEKAAYDLQYRIKNADKLRQRHSDYHKKTYDPAKAAIERKKNMPRHIEYCRKPEYRAKKVGYDQQHRAEKQFGEFAECFILLEQIDKTIASKADKHHLRTIQGTNNKSKRRKKQWLRLLKNLPQLT